MNEHLESMIDELFDKGKSEFKIYKNGDNIAIKICNMDLDEITECSINVIRRILDLFPENQRNNIICIAKDTCKTKNGELFDDD